MPDFTSEMAATVLAWIEADPNDFAAACAEIRPDDPEGLATEITDVCSQIGGTEEDENPNDAPDDTDEKGATV